MSDTDETMTDQLPNDFDLEFRKIANDTPPPPSLTSKQPKPPKAPEPQPEPEPALDRNFQLWDPEQETPENLAKISFTPTEDILDQQLQEIELGRCAIDVRGINPIWQDGDVNRPVVPQHVTDLQTSFLGGIRRLLRAHCIGISMTPEELEQLIKHNVQILPMSAEDIRGRLKNPESVNDGKPLQKFEDLLALHGPWEHNTPSNTVMRQPQCETGQHRRAAMIKMATENPKVGLEKMQMIRLDNPEHRQLVIQHLCYGVIIYDATALATRPDLRLHLRSNKNLTYKANSDGDNFHYLLEYYEKMPATDKEELFGKRNPTGLTTWIRNSVGAANWGPGDMNRLSRLLKHPIICELAHEMCKTAWARSAFTLGLWDNILSQKLPENWQSYISKALDTHKFCFGKSYTFVTTSDLVYIRRTEVQSTKLRDCDKLTTLFFPKRNEIELANVPGITEAQWNSQMDSKYKMNVTLRHASSRQHRRPNFLERASDSDYKQAYTYLTKDVFKMVKLLDGKVFAHEASSVMEIVSPVLAFIHYLWHPTWERGGNSSAAYAQLDWVNLLIQDCFPSTVVQTNADATEMQEAGKRADENRKAVTEFVDWLRDYVRQGNLVKNPGVAKIKTKLTIPNEWRGLIDKKTQLEIAGIMREKWMADIVKNAFDRFDGRRLNGVGAVLQHASVEGFDWFLPPISEAYPTVGHLAVRSYQQQNRLGLSDESLKSMAQEASADIEVLFLQREYCNLAYRLVEVIDKRQPPADTNGNLPARLTDEETFTGLTLADHPQNQEEFDELLATFKRIAQTLNKYGPQFSEDPVQGQHAKMGFSLLRTTSHKDKKPKTTNEMLLEGYQTPRKAAIRQQSIDLASATKQGHKSLRHIIDDDSNDENDDKNDDEDAMANTPTKSRKTYAHSTPHEGQIQQLSDPTKSVPMPSRRRDKVSLPTPASPKTDKITPKGMPTVAGSLMTLDLDARANPFTLGVEEANEFVRENSAHVTKAEQSRVTTAINKQREVWYKEQHGQKAKLPSNMKYSSSGTKRKRP